MDIQAIKKHTFTRNNLFIAPNPKGALVCCDGCGRDTTTRIKLCDKCNPDGKKRNENQYIKR